MMDREKWYDRDWNDDRWDDWDRIDREFDRAGIYKRDNCGGCEEDVLG